MGTTNTANLYEAVEALKDMAVDALTTIENAGDIEPLIEQLCFVRDKADAFREVAIKVSVALSELA
jgi:predicted xylose isomerase-like sugar epimerase